MLTRENRWPFVLFEACTCWWLTFLGIRIAGGPNRPTYPWYVKRIFKERVR